MKSVRKRLTFAFDKTDLTTISVKPDESRELVHDVFVAANLFDKIRLLENIKSGNYIPIMNFTPAFAAGACGYSDAGSLALSDKTIITKLLKSDLTMCPHDLAGSAFEIYLPEGASEEDLSILDQIKLYLTAKYAKAIQTMALKGTTGAASIDGLLTLAYASTDVVDVEGTAPTTSDALDKLFAVYEAMDDASLSSDNKPIIICGMDWLRKASIQSYNDNRPMFNFVIDDENGFTLPTTNVRVQGFDELNATNKLLAGSALNMVIGTDLQDDITSLKVWWSEDNQEIRSNLIFRIGAQLLFETQLRRYNVVS